MSEECGVGIDGVQLYTSLDTRLLVTRVFEIITRVSSRDVYVLNAPGLGCCGALL